MTSRVLFVLVLLIVWSVAATDNTTLYPPYPFIKKCTKLVHAKCFKVRTKNKSLQNSVRRCPQISVFNELCAMALDTIIYTCLWELYYIWLWLNVFFNVSHSLSLNHFKLCFLFETSFKVMWNVEMIFWFKHREIQKLLLLDFTSSAIKNSVCRFLTKAYCLPETRSFVKKNENF